MGRVRGLKTWFERRGWLLGVLFVAPALVIQLAFHVYPIFYSVYLSLTNWNMLQPVKRFVGLSNYQQLFGSGDFWHMVQHTAYYSFGTVFLTISLGLVLAVIINDQTRLSSFVQSAVFSPYVVSTVAVSAIWLWLLNADFGLFNMVLKGLGLPKLHWLTDPQLAMPSLIMVATWKGLGYSTLLCLAGLQSVPRELYEAASVEGTPKWRQFWAITVPMLSPTLFFLAVVSILGTFQSFDIVSMMTRGGPVDATTVWVYYIYQYGFTFFRIGYASAAAIVLFLVLATMTFVQFRFVQRRVFYS